MKKNIIKIFLVICFVFFNIIIHADENSQNTKVITGIKVQGLKNYSEQVVLRAISIHIGDFVSRQTIRQDIDKLYKLSFFSDIQVETTESEKGIILTYVVKENSILNNIEFIGNEKIKRTEIEDDLKAMLSDKILLGIGYFPGVEKPTLEHIIDFYRTKGFYYIKVTTETELDENSNRIVLRFIIDEGSKEEVTIKEINFKGNNSFSAYRLHKQMETKEYFPILEDGYYKENFFKGDLKKLVDFYKDNGFVNAKILNHTIDFDKKNNMFINIEIYEGPKYEYGDITIKGNTVFPDKEVLSWITIKKEELYKQKEVNNNTYNISSKYSENGYISAQVKVNESINEETKTIALNFDIIENFQMYLYKIIIEGNDITKDKVIRRELTVMPGEIFNTKKVQRSVQRIYNLGFFKDIKIDTEPGNTENNLSLKLKLEEKPTGQANFAATYSGTDGVIGQIQIAKNNFLGYGQRIDLTWEFGKNLQNYELGFTDPYILDTKFLFGINVFDTRQKKYTNDYFGQRDLNGNVVLVKDSAAYEYKKIGGGIRIGRPISENLNFSILYNYEDGEYFTVGTYLLPSDVILGKTATRSLTSSLSYDTRDNVFNPTIGVKHKFMWEKAGGFLDGNNNYNKLLLDSFFYQKTFSKFVLMLHTQMGLVDPYGSSDDVPPIEKFSIGGGNTVRGYDERSIADRKKREFYFNLEHTYPIEDNINFVIFLDSGNAWDNNNDIQLKDLKSGAGLGIHMETPIGPVRLDYGWGLNLEPGDEKSKFHFNLGWGFF